LFSCALALAQNLLPMLAIWLRWSPWAAVVHGGAVVLAVAMITLVVTIVYGLAARLVPRERFDDVAAWSQIGLALVFVALAVVTPRATLRPGGPHIDPGSKLLVGLAPAWFAGLETGVATGRRDVLPLAVAALVALAGFVVGLRGPVLQRLSEALAHVQD